MKNKLSKAIVRRRKELHLTQEKLAERNNLSINYISRIERGSSSHISANSLLKIANALNMNMETLMGKSKPSDKILGPNQASLTKYLASLDLAQSEKLCQQVLDLLTKYYK